MCGGWVARILCAICPGRGLWSTIDIDRGKLGDPFSEAMVHKMTDESSKRVRGHGVCGKRETEREARDPTGREGINAGNECLCAVAVEVRSKI